MNPAELNLNPLTQIDPVLIASIVVIFVATLFALSRVFVKPYLAVIEEREHLFDEADEAYREAEDLEAAASQEAQQLLDDCAHECDEIRSGCHDRCEAYQRETMVKATADASAILEKGRAEIAEARTSQSEELRTQVAECVGIACTRLLGDSDSRVVDAAVDRAMARRMG